MALIAIGCGLLIAAWAIHYRLVAVRMPLLECRPSTFNQRIIAKLEQLGVPYRPTPWLYNTHLQLLWLVMKEAAAPELCYERTDRLSMPDGGTTSLDWIGLASDAQTPTIVVLPTISGDARSMRSFVSDVRRRTGWRIVVCTRRGHGTLPLTAAVINTMGSTDDLRNQLSAIQHEVPKSPLYGIGVSAGSGLLARYLGEEGSRSLLRAGVGYCPGYDISVAFKRAHPFYSRRVTEVLKRQFVAPHAALFGHFATYNECMASTSLAAFQDSIFEMAGCSSRDEYNLRFNPMAVFDRIAVPALIVNADDDPLCTVQNILDHREAVTRVESLLLVRTARGSHCAHFEGWTARSSWANRLIANYLLAVNEEVCKP